MAKKLVLVILDGWGIGKNWGGNAVLIAKTPNYNRLLREYPNTSILAHGSNVGLPGREVGNSEVGHMNLGAGKIVEQDSFLINKSIASGGFYKNKVLVDTISNSKNNNSTLHLIGIVSDGGIHSHINHLLALLKMAKDIGHKKVLIHVFTDGRDTPPLKAIEFIDTLEYACQKLKTGKIATIIGRHYLDRKGNWSRTKIAYDAIASGVGIVEKNARSAISNAYKDGQDDQYIVPRIIKDNFEKTKDGDAVIFFNFRSDRTKQLTLAFLENDFKYFKRDLINNLDFVTFIPYGMETEITSKAKPAFESPIIKNGLSSFAESLNFRQLHIAETEKFAHVTYFFNGNRNEPFKGEDRMLIPSPDVGSYAEIPEMSSEKVKQALISAIERSDHQFILCNFANGDMVGHTGDFNAAVKAVEALDVHIKEITRTCIDKNVNLLITADHGNIEQMVDPETGMPDPEHTRNPVPLILISENKNFHLYTGGRLANVASTLLKSSGYEIPQYFERDLLDYRS